MKYYEVVKAIEVVRTETTVEIPYTKARNLILWRSANGETLISNMSNQHLRNLITYVESQSNKNKRYNELTYREWLSTFREEMKYRKLYISYNEYVSRYL